MKNLKNFRLLILISTIMLSVNAQNSKKKTMTQVKTPKVETLNIKPSTTSSENDFDFLQGKWKVYNRMLTSRLTNSTEWIEFDSELHMKKTLNGLGNIENFYS